MKEGNEKYFGNQVVMERDNENVLVTLCLGQEKIRVLAVTW
jgi:hypothetical protein